VVILVYVKVFVYFLVVFLRGLSQGLCFSDDAVLLLNT